MIGGEARQQFDDGIIAGGVAPLRISRNHGRRLAFRQ